MNYFHSNILFSILEQKKSTPRKVLKPKQKWIQRSIDTVTEEDIREVPDESNVQNSFDAQINVIENELKELQEMLAERRNQLRREEEAQRVVNQITTQVQVHGAPDPSFYQQGDDIRLNLGLGLENTTTENGNDQDHLDDESTDEAQNLVQQDGGPEIGSVNEPMDPTDVHVTPEDHENADELVVVPEQNDTPGEVQAHDQNRQQKTTTVECEFCSRQFKNRFTLAKHKRLQHSKDGKLRSKKKKCKTCNTFKTKNNFKRHMKTCAKNMERKRRQLLDRECALCDKIFKNKASRDNHFSKMHYNAPTQCSDCDEEVTYSYLAQHKERDCKNPPIHEEEEEDESEQED